MAYGDASWQRGHFPNEDLLGLDRLGRALLRTVARLPPGTMVAVHGAPGGGKSELIQRMGALVMEESRSSPTSGIYPNAIFYNPWEYSKQGHVLAGLLAHIAKSPPNPHPAFMERARDIANYLGRMHFDIGQATGFGSVLAEGDTDPIDRVQRGFLGLVEGIKGGAPGRVIVLVDGLDMVSPSVRFQFIDGCRLLLFSGADITLVMSVGREAALSAMRYREGNLTDASAQREWDELIALSVNVPPLDARRIQVLLRRFLGDGERTVTRIFGKDAMNGLSAAVAHRPLGSPRFLERLASRVTLLAEFTAELRATRELSPAQWAWLVVGERWPDFRRFMIRGGRERWVDLQHYMRGGGQSGPADGEGAATAKWLQNDQLLAEYLLSHADELLREIENVFWMENLLLAAGL